MFKKIYLIIFVQRLIEMRRISVKETRIVLVIFSLFYCKKLKLEKIL